MERFPCRTDGECYQRGEKPVNDRDKGAPRHTFRNRSAGMTGPVLRVLSYNVQGHASPGSRRYLEEVAAVIVAAQPDVVGLQEVHRGTRRARREDQAETLARLTGMTVQFGPSFAFGGGEFGNAVLTTGEVRAAEVVPLPAPGEPRTVLHSRLAVGHARHLEIDVYVTHLASWGVWNRAARRLQISGLVERLRQSSGPFVLVGDFNAAPGAPELRPLLAAETFRICGEGMAHTHRYLRRRIDYVLADRGWTTTASRVIQAGPSDHWPVLVELRRDSPP
jgi:endonuclease/exonuclease/phosphatase family metal-dependent hydrolase